MAIGKHTDIFEKCFKFTRAKELMAAGLYPYFRMIESAQDPEVVIKGKRMIMGGSNNYLGLTNHPKVKEACIETVQNYGSGCAGSRFLNGTLDIHVQLEEKLARFIRKEEALVFSTGFQVNLGVISALVGKNDLVIIDKMDHASIIDGCRLTYGANPACQVVFCSPQQAILAAVEAQRNLRQVAWGENVSLPVRMGLHSGLLQPDGHATGAGKGTATANSLQGAAWLASAAHGGQILVSEETAKLVRRELPAGLSIKNLGLHRSMGLARAGSERKCPGLPGVHLPAQRAGAARAIPTPALAGYPPQQPASSPDQLHWAGW